MGVFIGYQTCIFFFPQPWCIWWNYLLVAGVLLKDSSSVFFLFFFFCSSKRRWKLAAICYLQGLQPNNEPIFIFFSLFHFYEVCSETFTETATLRIINGHRELIYYVCFNQKIVYRGHVYALMWKLKTSCEELKCYCLSHHRRFTTSSKRSRDSKIKSGKQWLYLMVMGILTTDEFHCKQRQKLMK